MPRTARIVSVENTGIQHRQAGFFFVNKELAKRISAAWPGRFFASVWLFVLALGLPGIPCSALAADDAILERSYLRDDTGERTVAEVRKLPFTLYTGLLSQGYQRNVAFWLKVKVRGDNPDASPWVLRVRPARLNDIRLFDPSEGSVAERVTGSVHPSAANELPLLNHAFLLHKSREPREVYLRIQSVSTYLVDVQVLERLSAEQYEQKLEWVHLSYISAATVILLWAVAGYIRRRDRLLGVFAINQLFIVLYGFFVIGFGRIALDGLIAAPSVDEITQVVLILTVVVGLAFYQMLLAEYPLSRIFSVPLHTIVCLAAVPLVLYAVGDRVGAQSLNAAAVLGFASVAFLAAWLGIAPAPTLRPGQLPRWSMRLIFTPFFLIMAFGTTTLMGWRETDEFPLYLYLTHGALSTTIVAALLGYRDRRLAERQIEELALVRQTAEHERRAREEQTRFMTMLNHELKTPLSVLKLMVANHPQRALAEDTIDDMTSLLERCLLNDRLAYKRAIERSEFAPSDILMSVMHKTRHPERFRMEGVEPHVVSSDPEFYAIIVNNLLDNALKYSPVGSAITVSLGTQMLDDKAMSCLSVCNLIGRAGVPEPSRVFDKYYRAESAKAISGTGLGLYLVKSFSEMLGGNVDCAIGTKHICFHLCLPL